MPPLKIAILSGGISSEREVSLKSGSQVYAALAHNPRFETSLIDIRLDLSWYDCAPGKTPHNISATLASKESFPFDIAFIALHGKYGEDGAVQSYLDELGIPYTGSGAGPSALGMDKAASSYAAQAAGLRVPQFILANKNDLQKSDLSFANVASQLGDSFVIKPNRSGSSMGITMVRSPEDFQRALTAALQEDDSFMMQRRIEGKEFTCGVLGNSGAKPQALPPVEIKTASDFFDYDAKYQESKTQEICPPQMDPAHLMLLQNAALTAHETLGCDGLTRSDFMQDNEGNFWYLETNTIPGLTSASLCPKEAAAAGMDFAHFIERIVDLALEKFEKK